jgi:hypothetical protein
MGKSSVAKIANIVYTATACRCEGSNSPHQLGKEHTAREELENYREPEN